MNASIRPPVRLSVRHTISSNQTCYMTSPQGKGIREQHSFFMHPCVQCLSICPSCYLLHNPLTEFNQTCYMASPSCKGVRKQYYFSLRRPSICITPSPSKPLGGIQPNLLHYLSSWLGCARATLFYRLSGVRPSVHLSVTLSFPNWAEFNQNLLQDFFTR